MNEPAEDVKARRSSPLRLPRLRLRLRLSRFTESAAPSVPRGALVPYDVAMIRSLRRSAAPRFRAPAPYGCC
ncbi:hypothetical protein TPA0905_21440 [Streptomyces olivaceus]|nr:hypothetical protein TPA0905_21440 [Streptomyces olivaceus]